MQGRNSNLVHPSNPGSQSHRSHHKLNEMTQTGSAETLGGGSVGKGN
jgi:hypothetical protein